MTEITRAAAELGRRRWANGDNPREVGARGGRPRKPRDCPRCGAPCSSTRAAGEHCRRKRGEPRAVKTPAPAETACPPAQSLPDFAAFERANGPWVSPEAARQAWEQLQRDLAG